MDQKKEISELKERIEHLEAVSSAKEKVLLAYIREADELYRALSGKVAQIKEKNLAIEQTRTIMSQNERLFTLGVMSASIFHEIKNPMIVVMGLINKLAGLATDSKELEFLHVVQKELDRIQGIITRMKNYYKPAETEKELYDINELIRETVRFTDHYLSRFNKVEVKTALADGIPSCVFNKGQIQQVLVNLLINSAQAMPEGGSIVISTVLEKKESYADRVRIDVEDTGIGISEENMKNIFSPFFSTKAPGEGTGLGLSICKEIVERHEGEISLVSTVAKGTTFSILLPC